MVEIEIVFTMMLFCTSIIIIQGSINSFSQEMNRYGIHIHLSEYYSGEAYVRIKLMKVPIK